MADLLGHMSITLRLLYYIGPVYHAKGYDIMSSNVVSQETHVIIYSSPMLKVIKARSLTIKVEVLNPIEVSSPK